MMDDRDDARTGESADNDNELSAELPELALLRSARTSAEWDALTTRIVAAADSELARRRGTFVAGRWELAPAVVAWARPVLAAAAVLLAVGVFALRHSASTTALPTVAELLGVNEPTATWLADGSAPTIGDVARSLEDSAAQETP